MKVLVISDSHGHLANLKHVLGFGQKIKAGAVIHAGDWNTVESVETVLSFGIPLYTVLGNADIDPSVNEELRIKSEEFSEDYVEFELGGKKIGIIHNINILPDVDVLFCGHTHQQFEEMIEGIKVVNPGALENGTPFAIYDTITDKIEFINDQI